jgi:hypothetical protein
LQHNKVCLSADFGLNKADGSDAGHLVLCGDFGDFLVGSAHFVEWVAYPELDELLKVRKAVVLAPDYRVRKVVLEVECRSWQLWCFSTQVHHFAWFWTSSV